MSDTKPKPKPIAEIPRYLRPGGSLGGDILEISFWTDGDVSANLHFCFSSDEIREIEDYGISENLIEWMRDTGQVIIDYYKKEDFETFKITDELIKRFYINDTGILPTE